MNVRKLLVVVVALVGCTKSKESAPPVVNTAPTAAVSGAPSLDAWCQGRSAAFDKARCTEASESTACGCERADSTQPTLTTTITGPTVATVTKGGPVVEAALVRIADAASAPVQCAIAVKLADGWHVHERAFACGDAITSPGENMISVEVQSFTANGPMIELRGATVTTNMEESDGPGGHLDQNDSKPAAFTVSCKAAGTVLSCTTT